VGDVGEVKNRGQDVHDGGEGVAHGACTCA
jgi:hypothetical protein